MGSIHDEHLLFMYKIDIKALRIVQVRLNIVTSSYRGSKKQRDAPIGLSTSQTGKVFSTKTSANKLNR